MTPTTVRDALYERIGDNQLGWAEDIQWKTQPPEVLRRGMLEMLESEGIVNPDRAALAAAIYNFGQLVAWGVVNRDPDASLDTTFPLAGLVILANETALALLESE